MDAELYQYIEALVRAVVEETFAELDDAEAFLAIETDDDWDPQLAAYNWATSAPNAEPISIHTLRVARAQLMGIVYHGRWENLSYSDHAFLYDVGISLDNPDGGLL